jgi:hypothetical protein
MTYAANDGIAEESRFHQHKVDGEPAAQGKKGVGGDRDLAGQSCFPLTRGQGRAGDVRQMCITGTI